MITTKAELRYYINQDRIALNVAKEFNLLQKVKSYLFPNEIIKYQRLLRYLEYYSNKKRRGILYYYYRYLFHQQSLKLGFSIPINVCAEGLSIAHYGSIVISPNAKIGKYCRIHTGVNIGASAGKSDAPQIGDNVYIGPGAILFGNIHIANNVTVGANSTVNKSCETENVVLAGTPAKIVKEKYNNWLEFNHIQTKQKCNRL